MSMSSMTQHAIGGVMIGLAAISTPLRAQSHRPLHVDPSVGDCEVRFASNLTQSAYHRFVREFGGVSAFKQVTSATTLGRGRVSIAMEMMRFSLDEWADAWHDTFVHPNDDHPLESEKEFPKVNVRVGATDNLDVGAFYTSNPSANYGWLGVDGKYRLMAEGVGKTVSLAVRGAYTRTLYVSDMSMHAFTADISADRRVWQDVRTYAGVGADAVIGRETSAVVNLRDETVLVPHLFAGVEALIRSRLSVGAEFALGALPSLHLQVGGIFF